MAKILMVVDRLPFPPRNGETIVSYNHLRCLAARHDVSLLWLKDPGMEPSPLQIEANEKLVAKLWTVETCRGRTAWALLDELALRRPAWATTGLDEDALPDACRSDEWDVVWCTPVRPVAYIGRILEGVQKSSTQVVAAISDVYTALLHSMGSSVWEQGWPIRFRVRNCGAWIRSGLMARLEPRVLSWADVILVQTPVDQAWVSRISRGTLADRTVALPNGVDDILLRGSLHREEGTVMYVGSLASPEHVRTVTWCLRKVWPLVLTELPDAKFIVVGKRGCGQLMAWLTRQPGCLHIPHIQRTSDLYTTSSAIIIWSPKMIGLINRTLEAMAAGTLVVGDSGAFNGIEGFSPGEHGLVVRNAVEMARALIAVFSGRINRHAITAAARDMIRKRHTWEHRFPRLLELVDDLSRSDVQSHTRGARW